LQKEQLMNYRRLGDAGIKLSEIGLGGWLTFGNAMEAEQARSVMHKAFDIGINFFDTANAYAGGKAEEAWGELLQGRRRDSFVLATKVWNSMGPGPTQRGLSRKHVFEQCHASLRRLRVDHIDLYQCHRFDEETPLEETVRIMDDLVRQGKVLYWGFSNWNTEQVEQCLKICGDRYYRPRSSQPRYNLIARDAEKDLMPLCHRAGIGQVVYSPLAQGVLTGKYKPDQPPPGGSRASDQRQNQFVNKTLENKQLVEKVQKLQPLASEAGCSMSQLALSWCLRRPEVTSCIIGASRPQQVEENAEASGIKLEEKTIRRVEEIMS
jgi:voltage-dependent potassium channel beta subunit